MSPIDAGRIPPERPPGKVRVELVPILMPPQYSAMSSFTVMPAGARCTPGFFTRPDTENERRPFLPVAAVLREPLRAVFDEVAHPEQRLHVVLERGAAEEADLRDVRRAKARHAALAFDGFDHRGLFAADVGARAAAQVDARQLRGGFAFSAAISRSSSSRHAWYSSRR
jgi:hypothetical protein